MARQRTTTSAAAAEKQQAAAAVAAERCQSPRTPTPTPTPTPIPSPTPTPSPPVAQRGRRPLNPPPNRRPATAAGPLLLRTVLSSLPASVRNLARVPVWDGRMNRWTWTSGLTGACGVQEGAAPAPSLTAGGLLSGTAQMNTVLERALPGTLCPDDLCRLANPLPKLKPPPVSGAHRVINPHANSTLTWMEEEDEGGCGSAFSKSFPRFDSFSHAWHAWLMCLTHSCPSPRAHLLIRAAL
ncbi:hypothetical protein M231_02982 [Tremella mesenterica]|uniref:Uncharacterized protein n=1 Tax=Tremella mesenterica TaxID=5217 RepID=A0A4Q1BPG3_TREME|nr:hypothetical protein M231_02982 [Tremella mesenterica]